VIPTLSEFSEGAGDERHILVVPAAAERNKPTPLWWAAPLGELYPAYAW
jgi:hypothetical protein